MEGAPSANRRDGEEFTSCTRHRPDQTANPHRLHHALLNRDLQDAKEKEKGKPSHSLHAHPRYLKRCTETFAGAPGPVSKKDRTSMRKQNGCMCLLCISVICESATNSPRFTLHLCKRCKTPHALCQGPILKHLRHEQHRSCQ